MYPNEIHQGQITRQRKRNENKIKMNKYYSYTYIPMCIQKGSISAEGCAHMIQS